ncbi:helix-turn-helix transcriptional regulator [Escherichia albertii]|uniref:helix-turn-helix domain-containing protein n=1 Tax=Escherichia albertii TaxID=208962 RepID=UPI001D3BC7B8|nr:helix-turn-helix transcriptional regulator [Escherichia albertii]EHX2144240.1 helix-turn-helix transcriptional regulator [Escherichia albertii]MCE7721101.1 helix-turn-helix transcriptional regulator [Escherichia albertii]MCE7724924.1 helix-turn-helix transcriptional regulator [Escherichia albertii]MCZ8864574.1 helix-turn-helix transcriptional regulator [Escherichia albertii]
MPFAETLRTLRHARNLTQAQLAELAGVTPLQIRRYEAGEAQPMLPAIHGLAVALQCSADALVFGTEADAASDTPLSCQIAAIAALPIDAQQKIQETLSALIAWYR